MKRIVRAQETKRSMGSSFCRNARLKLQNGDPYQNNLFDTKTVTSMGSTKQKPSVRNAYRLGTAEREDVGVCYFSVKALKKNNHTLRKQNEALSGPDGHF